MARAMGAVARDRRPSWLGSLCVNGREQRVVRDRLCGPNHQSSFSLSLFHAQIWDLASGNLKLTLTGHSHTVRGVVVSSRSPYLFSCGEDKAVKCWDLEYNRVGSDKNVHPRWCGPTTAISAACTASPRILRSTCCSPEAATASAASGTSGRRPRSWCWAAIAARSTAWPRRRASRRWSRDRPTRRCGRGTW